MQNQTAQRLLNGNGKDVFKIGKPTENEYFIVMKEKESIEAQLQNVMQKAAPKPHFWTWENVKNRWEHYTDHLKNKS